MSHKRRGAVLAVGILVLTTALMLPTSGTATAVDVPDQVLAWNQHAYNELIGTAAQPPLVAVFNFAKVHGAVYDAVNAIDGGYEPYLGAPSAQPTYSQDAAAAAAAYRMLLHILPGRAAQLEEYYVASLAVIPDGEAEDGGVEVGEIAAAAMIAERAGDGTSGGNPLFTEGTDPGEWRRVTPTGNNFQWVGDVEPFLLLSPSQFRSNGPLPLGSAAYAAEFNQVKTLGRATGSTRTADQTAMALFWSDHPIAMWDRSFRQIAVNEDLSTTENARLFGMLWLTGADALIGCFEAKEHWKFWRPTTAIHEAAGDGNPATVAEPAWTALLAVPPYPDDPSAHNCVSNSIVQTLQDFFGTNQMSFSATHATLGITRSYTRFSQAINEVRRARMYGGLHFMTADAHGATLGRNVADWRQDHYFQPA